MKLIHNGLGPFAIDAIITEIAISKSYFPHRLINFFWKSGVRLSVPI
jgi:hypothetical protein